MTGLLLDLDDTLVDDRAATREAFRALLAAHSPAVDEDAALERWRAIMWKHWPAAGLLGALEALGLTPPARIP